MQATVKHRVASRNVQRNLQSIFEIGKQEMARITSDDWKNAIRAASKQEALYIELDGIILDPLPQPNHESVYDNEIVIDPILDEFIEPIIEPMNEVEDEPMDEPINQPMNDPIIIDNVNQPANEQVTGKVHLCH